MKDFKPMVKMQAGGSVVLGNAANSGPMGEAKPAGPTQNWNTSLPGANTYKTGGKRKK